jgi:hypothetical protein
MTSLTEWRRQAAQSQTRSDARRAQSSTAHDWLWWVCLLTLVVVGSVVIWRVV